MRIGSMLLSIAATFPIAATGRTAPLDPTGTWKTDCLASSGGRGEYQIDEMTFSPNGAFRRELRRYSDKACSSPAVVSLQEIDGRYGMTGPASGVGAGAEKLDIHVDQMHTTALSDATVSDFIKSKYCSIEAWKKGERRSILGQPCFDLEPLKPGATIFDIAKIDGGKLYLGSKSFLRDGSTPEERPTAFGTAPFSRVAASGRTTH